jgi:hypothetical protein
VKRHASRVAGTRGLLAARLRGGLCAGLD